MNELVKKCNFWNVTFLCTKFIPHNSHILRTNITFGWNTIFLKDYHCLLTQQSPGYEQSIINKKFGKKIWNDKKLSKQTKTREHKKVFAYNYDNCCKVDKTWQLVVKTEVCPTVVRPTSEWRPAAKSDCKRYLSKQVLLIDSMNWKSV